VHLEIGSNQLQERNLPLKKGRGNPRKDLTAVVAAKTKIAARVVVVRAVAEVVVVAGIVAAEAGTVAVEAAIEGQLIGAVIAGVAVVIGAVVGTDAREAVAVVIEGIAVLIVEAVAVVSAVAALQGKGGTVIGGMRDEGKRIDREESMMNGTRGN